LRIDTTRLDLHSWRRPAGLLARCIGVSHATSWFLQPAWWAGRVPVHGHVSIHQSTPGSPRSKAAAFLASQYVSEFHCKGKVYSQGMQCACFHVVHDRYSSAANIGTLVGRS
jgi:hypothetical protein